MNDITLRPLYLARVAFAFVWAAVLLLSAPAVGPVLTVLLVVYPLFDAAAVLWQIRTSGDARASHVPEWINVAVSVIVALVLGFASTMSVAAVLVVWGVWAIGSGVPQLITAVRNRPAAGQVPQILSGGISVLAGAGFAAQGFQGADDIMGVGGYAVLGGIFFLISAVRLRASVRENA